MASRSTSRYATPLAVVDHERREHVSDHGVGELRVEERIALRVEERLGQGIDLPGEPALDHAPEDRRELGPGVAAGRSCLDPVEQLAQRRAAGAGQEAAILGVKEDDDPQDRGAEAALDALGVAVDERGERLAARGPEGRLDPGEQRAERRDGLLGERESAASPRSWSGALRPRDGAARGLADVAPCQRCPRGPRRHEQLHDGYLIAELPGGMTGRR